MSHTNTRLRVIKVLLVAQAGTSVLLALAALGFGVTAAKSVLLGGVVCWLPTSYFAWQAFRYHGARAARQIVRSFYVGEAGKMLLTVLLFTLVFMNINPLNVLALFIGYVGVQSLNWIVPLLVGRSESRHQSL